MKSLICLMDQFCIRYFKIILIYLKKKDGEKAGNPSIRMYINKLENRITFKIKTGYYLERLTPDARKLLRKEINKRP